MPTPTAGTGALLTAPVPNPVPFIGAPNQQLLSGQYNSNFYAVWNYATLIASALNGCTYVPGGAIATVAATYPISATLGACSAGVGASLSLSLAHGTDYVDTSAAQTIAGTKTFSAALVDALGFTAGSSSYGPSGAYVNGALGLATPLAIANGGTGAAAQNFVDLSSAQSIAGAKTFAAALVAGTSLTSNGLASATASGFSAAGAMAPIYSFTGAADGSANTHGLIGTQTCTTSSGGTCSVTTTFPSGGTYSNTGSYLCRTVFATGAIVGGYISNSNLSATQFGFNVVGGPASTALSFASLCEGY